MSINIKAIESVGGGLFKSASTNVGSKVIGSAGAAVAGLSVLGSYNAYKDTWSNEAALAQRNAVLDASAYQRKVGFIGNSVLDPIFSTIADPNFMFSDVLRKIYYNTVGFTRDVVMNNIIPITLGGTAAIWGFNQSLFKTLGHIGYSLVTTGKLGRKGYIALRRAIKAVMPKVDVKQIARFLTPKNPRAVLSLAVMGGLVGIYLPLTLMEASGGGLSRRIGENTVGAYRNRI